MIIRAQQQAKTIPSRPRVEGLMELKCTHNMALTGAGKALVALHAAGSKDHIIAKNPPAAVGIYPASTVAARPVRRGTHPAACPVAPSTRKMLWQLFRHRIQRPSAPQRIAPTVDDPRPEERSATPHVERLLEPGRKLSRAIRPWTMNESHVRAQKSIPCNSAPIATGAAVRAAAAGNGPLVAKNRCDRVVRSCICKRQ
jgi:hypothetical protein